MPTPPLTEQQIDDVIATWRATNGNQVKMAHLLGMSRSGIQNRIRRAQERRPEEFKALMAEADKKAADAKVEAVEQAEIQRTIQDEVKIHRAQSQASYARSKLKDAVAQISHLEEKVSEYEWLGNVDARPADWTMAPPKPGEKREHIPMLFTSDFQLGEVIDEAETEHGHGYDTDTFRRRYRRMIETTIKLSFEHAGKNWTYPGIIYARGGDTISGGIHDELAETDDLSPIEAVEIAFEEEAAGIHALLAAFGRVEVKDCGGGNHDRITHKPRAKKAYANFDRLINFMLRREFKDDPRVHFQNTMSMDVHFQIYEKSILLTHGDRIGSRGGQGFVGPAATIMRGAQKVIMEQSSLGRTIDMVMMGHFHTPMWLGWVMVNGSLPGYSEFAKMNRMRPHPPQQFLSYWFQGRGMVDLKPLILTDA